MFTTNSRDSITMKFVSIISAVVLVVGIFPISADAATLFSDGFESTPNHFANWTSIGADWDDINDAKNGSAAAEVKNTNSSELRKNVSTSGYNTLTLSYWYKIPGGLSSDDELMVQWSTDGSTWNTLVNYDGTATVSNWVQATHLLPVGAENNSGFRFRFLGESLSSSDKFRLDDVKIDGAVIPVDVCPNVSGTQTTTPCADTTCTQAGGVWSNNSCVPDACSNVLGHQASGPCADVTCVQNGGTWVNNDCDMPTAEELCDEDGGFWNGEGCEEIPSCDQNEEYNSETNECDEIVVDFCENVPDVQLPGVNCDEIVCLALAPSGWIWNGDDCVNPIDTEEECIDDGGFWNGEGCEEIPSCGEGQVYNSETNNCDQQSEECEVDCNQCEVDCGEVNNEENNTPSEEPRRGGTTNTVCNNNQDDDNDGLYDENDPGCENGSDGSEENAVGGEVAGASCGPILTSFLGLRGKENDPEAVKVVQEFLNKELGLSLEVNGEYNAETIEAVKAFQAKYLTDVLNPWGIGDSTGIVYLTTQRMINMIACPGLDLPMPELN